MENSKEFCDISKEIRELRDILRTSWASLREPEIHNYFFERIHFLKNCTTSEIGIAMLEAMGEEIEEVVSLEYSTEAPGWLNNQLFYGGVDGLQ